MTAFLDAVDAVPAPAFFGWLLVVALQAVIVAQVALGRRL